MGITEGHASSIGAGGMYQLLFWVAVPGRPPEKARSECSFENPGWGDLDVGDVGPRYILKAKIQSFNLLTNFAGIFEKKSFNSFVYFCSNSFFFAKYFFSLAQNFAERFKFAAGRDVDATKRNGCCYYRFVIFQCQAIYFCISQTSIYIEILTNCDCKEYITLLLYPS